MSFNRIENCKSDDIAPTKWLTMIPIRRCCRTGTSAGMELASFVRCNSKIVGLKIHLFNMLLKICSTHYLVIRRRSRKLGDPRRRGIDGDREERLQTTNE